MAAVDKPLPQITPEMAPFWEAARRHQLVVQRCRGCGAHRFPARDLCSRCLSREAEWVQVSGRGKVFSYAVMHQVYHPGFADEVPYAVVQVELEEGGRILTNVVGCSPPELAVDLPVEVVFEDRTPEVTLPKFRRRAPR
jgi:uncharacterized OB-fold protein